MTNIIYRMVIAYLAGKPDRVAELYEEYIRAKHLHVSIGEIIQAKRKRESA
jgi:hypothetical protein